jgi:hypothetical protein
VNPEEIVNTNNGLNKRILGGSSSKDNDEVRVILPFMIYRDKKQEIKSILRQK